MTAEPQIPFLTRSDAADFLTRSGFPITPGTLSKLAHFGGGPIYRKFGKRCLYVQSDLLAWANAKMSEPISSTSCND